MTAMAKRFPAAGARAEQTFAKARPGATLAPPEGLYIYWQHPYLRLLFSKYDVVQCYATYTAMPFLANWYPYLAYEHGTIRSIPFQDTDEGRLCLATYDAASAVFVTNTDNLKAASAMKLEPDRVVALPHAFDSDKLARFKRSSSARPPGDGPVIFITPTRQHWVDQDPGWAKGNDRVFEALARLVHAGHDVRLRAVAWGNDLEASKARIEELGIADRVDWLKVLRKRELWTQYLSSHAVIDQFLVPAFSGVTFESMMLGRPLITALDQDEMQAYFGSIPPHYNAVTAGQIHDAMLAVVENRGAAEALGQQAQAWMLEHHSADRIVKLQVDRYARLVGSAGERQ